MAEVVKSSDDIFVRQPCCTKVENVLSFMQSPAETRPNFVGFDLQTQRGEKEACQTWPKGKPSQFLSRKLLPYTPRERYHKATVGTKAHRMRRLLVGLLSNSTMSSCYQSHERKCRW